MINLKIRLDSAALNSIKGDLLKLIPDVQSSHRLEATARGFGFTTYASMKHAAETVPADVQIDGGPFERYLNEHGQPASPNKLYFLGAKVAMRTVLAMQPKLSRMGIGHGNRQRKPDRNWETPEEHHRRFLDARDELVDCGAEEFLRSLAFLARIKPIKNPSGFGSSYWLKHIAENYQCNFPDGDKLGPAYVSNGALIAAALHLGFKMKTYFDSPNATFNMSKASLVALDIEIRPDGSRAQQAREERERQEYARRVLRGANELRN